MKKLAVLSNINLEPIKRFLGDPFVDPYFAGFNQYIAELVGEDSETASGNYDIVILHLDGTELLSPYFASISRFEDISEQLESDLESIFRAVEGYALRHERATVILNTLVISPYNVNTYLDTNSEYSFRMVRDFSNARIMEFSQKYHNILVWDWERVVGMHGYENLYDSRFFYLGRIRYNDLAHEKIAEGAASIVNANSDKARKVLVLDLDNTLWGGIIGEDGIEGVALSEDGLGKAYRDFQKELKSAKDLGVLLALCSKNNLADARECFEKHPMMVLSLDDFVSVKIDWNDKASNIKAIARELNLGLDHFVFIDDNQVEREVVRSFLPEVAVPDFPEDVSNLLEWVANDVFYPYFPKVFLTGEDREKTRQYMANIKRSESAGKLDLGEFIASLQITTHVHVDDDRFVERLSQISQKTNQFNLTTRRYAQGDIEHFMGRDDCHVYGLEYEDKFNKEGIVGSAIVFLENSQARIDLLLLSCRVIGRKVEFIFLHDILEHLGKAHPDISTIQAEYIVTPKNAMVKDFYANCGMRIDVYEDGLTRYIAEPEVMIKKTNSIRKKGTGQR